MDITRTLGVPPSYTHRRGERHAHRPYRHDMWSYVTYLFRAIGRLLHVHIDTLYGPTCSPIAII